MLLAKAMERLLLCSCSIIGHIATYDLFSYPLTDTNVWTQVDCADIIRENGQLLERILHAQEVYHVM